MTGLDCLREEMKKRGCSKQQIESQTAAVVLDILANMGTINADIVESEKQLAETKRKQERELQYLEIRRVEAKRREAELQERLDEQKAYVENFLNELSDCETPEARDAMKRAEWFKRSVEVNSKYDNAAFIIALGAILSCGKYDAAEELRKLNSKLFQPEVKKDMSILKSCPFCGADNKDVHIRRQGGNGYRVICGSCGGQGPYAAVKVWHSTKYIAQKQAADGWNRRAAIGTAT